MGQGIPIQSIRKRGAKGDRGMGEFDGNLINRLWMTGQKDSADEFDEVLRDVLGNDYFSLDESNIEDRIDFWQAEDIAFRKEKLAEVVSRYLAAKRNPKYVVNLVQRFGVHPCDILDLMNAGTHLDEIWYLLSPCVRTRRAVHA